MFTPPAPPSIRRLGLSPKTPCSLSLRLRDADDVFENSRPSARAPQAKADAQVVFDASRGEEGTDSDDSWEDWALPRGDGDVRTSDGESEAGSRDEDRWVAGWALGRGEEPE